jgi:hypothetical protein
MKDSESTFGQKIDSEQEGSFSTRDEPQPKEVEATDIHPSHLSLREDFPEDTLIRTFTKDTTTQREMLRQRDIVNRPSVFEARRLGHKFAPPKRQEEVKHPYESKTSGYPEIHLSKDYRPKSDDVNYSVHALTKETETYQSKDHPQSVYTHCNISSISKEPKSIHHVPTECYTKRISSIDDNSHTTKESKPRKESPGESSTVRKHSSEKDTSPTRKEPYTRGESPREDSPKRKHPSSKDTSPTRKDPCPKLESPGVISPTKKHQYPKDATPKRKDSYPKEESPRDGSPTRKHSSSKDTSPTVRNSYEKVESPTRKHPSPSDALPTTKDLYPRAESPRDMSPTRKHYSPKDASSTRKDSYPKAESPRESSPARKHPSHKDTSPARMDCQKPVHAGRGIVDNPKGILGL